MPCDMERFEALAEQGWTDDEVQQLRKEVELARAEANQMGYQVGATRSTQRQMEDIAEQRARKVAHDRFHAKLEAAMEEIRGLARNVVPVHANAHDEVKALGPAQREKLKKLLGEM